jgi:hypothetical protein
MLIFAAFVASCGNAGNGTPQAYPPEFTATHLASPTHTNPATPIPTWPVSTDWLDAYAFPASIDPDAEYLFYLHGRIIEDQGLPAISPDFGEYEYEAILVALQAYDYLVISEQREADTDGIEYARRVTGQVTQLLEAGVPPEAITIVGASKGAGIAVYVSHFLANAEINVVLLSICHPDTAQEFLQNKINLYGNVLSIYDASDVLAGSCEELFTFSEGKGIARHEEVVLEIGTGHGILYQPLIEWVLPAVEWGRKH